MDTRALDLFIEVAQSGSFAAAARRRNLDPSSISRAIAALESDFGARLFQRSTRQLSLTEAGQRFLERVEPILQDLEEAKDTALAARTEPGGTLKISASVAFGSRCIVPYLTDFLARYPMINVELDLADRNINLVTERMDLAVRLGPSPDVDLIGVRLMDTHYKVCASPGYLTRTETISKPDDLSDHSIASFALPAYRTAWTFRSAEGATREVPVAPRTIISNALGLREAALAGVGVSLLADWLIEDDLARGTLVQLLPDYAVTATTFDTAAWLLYPSRSFLPRKTKVMIDFLRETLPRN